MAENFFINSTCNQQADKHLRLNTNKMDSFMEGEALTVKFTLKVSLVLVRLYVIYEGLGNTL